MVSSVFRLKILNATKPIDLALDYMDSQIGLNDTEEEDSEIKQLPTIYVQARPSDNIPENVTITMTTQDKILLALDFGVTVASIFVLAIGLARLAIFGYRFYKAAKAAQRVNQASKVLVPAF